MSVDRRKAASIRFSLVDLFQGLWVTFRNQHPKNIYTEQYPAARPKVAERYRGAPRLNINPENGETLCISLRPVREGLPGETDRRHQRAQRADATQGPDHFTYDTSRCMFCGLCEDACPVDALELTQDFEMATLHPGRPDLGPPDARRGCPKSDATSST